MKCILLLPDGVGVRNFVFGPFLHEVSSKVQVTLLHPFPPGQLEVYGVGTPNPIDCHALQFYRESPTTYTLRYSLDYAQMWWADTKGMRRNRNKPIPGSWRSRATRTVAKWIGFAAASPHRISVLDHWHQQTISKLPIVNKYRRLFQQIKPSILFCTHQRPPIVLPPVLAARSLGIPTATFIFSWDNLTTKGRIAAPFDHFLVWSDLMRQELLYYYPDVSPERVHIVGTPQFDPYVDPNLIWSRSEFFAHIAADPSRPLICYSGGDTGTCPEDPAHVRILVDQIRQEKIKGNPQVVLRPAPVDDGTRYAQVRQDFPELIYVPPAWNHGGNDWSLVFPSQEDVQFLANLTQYADLNVNMASTMTLDFALHDKPVVNVAFDVGHPPPHGIPLWDHYYQYEHYRPVVEIGAARFARSPQELADHVNAYLADPALDREKRQQLVDLEVGVPLGGSSRRIVEVLQSISRTV